MAEKHVMVDLETLSTAPDAAIVQIGAVEFDPLGSGLGSEFEAHVSPQSCIDAGLRVDGSTINWWMNQPDEARKAVFVGEARHVQRALADFRFWLAGLGEVHGLWSHGAAFDIPILLSAARRCGFQEFWGYRTTRDTRTLAWLAGGLAGPPPRVGVEHTALADAKSQAMWVQQTIANMRATRTLA